MAECLFTNSKTHVIVVFFLWHVFVPLSIEACGISTHIEIGHRAYQFFDGKGSDKYDYKQLIEKHQDAFQGGNPYPDTFYDPVCKKGLYHDVSEDTHWVPFMNATINYIRRKYPQPWDSATEKLVVFMMGYISHQVADVTWHSLGIDQGFLDTMGQLNFYGSFNDAHGTGDTGGDVLVNKELDTSYVPWVKEWYIPTDDLYEIYKEYYGATKIDKATITECSAIMFLARLGEKAAAGKAFPYYAEKSPFLVDNFNSYFLGGVDDMVTWTQYVWHQAIEMLDNGTESCSLTKNPIYINCKDNKNQEKFNHLLSKRKALYASHKSHGFEMKDLEIKKSHRGVVLKPSEGVKEMLIPQNKKNILPIKLHDKTPPVPPFHEYKTEFSYSRMGWDIHSCDLNNDGNEDAIVSAPGYSVLGKYQTGRVYIVYGSENGLPQIDGNIENIANMTLEGPDKHGRFGSSVTVIDLNMDHIPDLVVSAPAVGSRELFYQGAVYIYFGGSKLSSSPNVTLQCKQKYCGFGWKLFGHDFNHDGFKDLVIGSPYAGGGGNQRGLVYLLQAKKLFQKLSVEKTLTDSDMDLIIMGEQDYSWFGYSLEAGTSSSGSSFLIVGAPGFRKCAKSDCSHNKNDTQAIGRIYIYDTTNPKKPLTILTGERQYDMLGSSLSVGNPYGKGKVTLAAGLPGRNSDGAVLGEHFNIAQGGLVNLYDISNVETPKVVAYFEGNRMFDRFGSVLKFADIDNDGNDDLIIGAPLYTEDFTDEISGAEQGMAYVYIGTNGTFPKGDVTSHCAELSLTPCPSRMAEFYFYQKENQARLGHTFAVIHSKKKVQIMTSAVHSNTNARLSGKVLVFEIL